MITPIGLIRLQELVRSPPVKNMEVYIRQATKDTYRKILREVKKRNIGNVIVDTHTEHIDAFFRAVSRSIISISVNRLTQGVGKGLARGPHLTAVRGGLVGPRAAPGLTRRPTN